MLQLAALIKNAFFFLSDLHLKNSDLFHFFCSFYAQIKQTALWRLNEISKRHHWSWNEGRNQTVSSPTQSICLPVTSLSLVFTPLCSQTLLLPHEKKDESLFLFASRHWRLWWRCRWLQPLTLLSLLLDQSADRSCHCLPLLLQLHCVNDAFAQAVQSTLSLGCILMIHVSEQLEMDVFMTLPGGESGLKVQAFWKMDALIALCIRGRYCAQTQIQLLNCH